MPRSFKRIKLVALIVAFALGMIAHYAISQAGAATTAPKPEIVHVGELLGRDKLAFNTPGGWVQPLASSPTVSLAIIKQTTVAAHSHSGPDEFVYVISGTGTATIAGHSSTVRDGDLLIVPRGVVHSFSVRKGTLNVLAFFSPPLNFNDVHWVKH